jgi:restriction system protein
MAQRGEPDAVDGRTIGFRLPVWATLLCGSLLWAVPRVLAEGAQTTTLSLAGLRGLFAHQVLPALNDSLSYLGLALIGLVLALLLQTRRRRRQIAALRDPVGAPLREMSRKDFARVVGRAFRRQGYRVLRGRSPAGGDEVDLEVTKDGRRYLVHCGYWREWQVGVEAVQGVGELMIEKTADGSFVVISGEFTRAAERFAGGRRTELVDLHRLREMACGRDRPKFGVTGRPVNRFFARRLVVGGLAATALAVLAAGGARWWAASYGPSAGTGRTASAQTTTARHQAKHQHHAYRADTPILPAVVRMDFPEPGQLQSTKPVHQPVERDAAAARDKIADELEADFDASYHPPAYCDNWQSQAQMVACGNDRIRAWKEYQAKHWALRRLDTARAEIPPSE